VEAGMFGRNTAIGAGAPLDGSIALNQTIGQVAGSGVVAEAHILKKSPRKVKRFLNARADVWTSFAPSSGTLLRRIRTSSATTNRIDPQCRA
jgi:hypothetical protein